MSARRSRKNAGYTMIEVAAALGILAVGAAGVIALQKATYISQVHARNLVIANAIAASWAERIRVDALQWNDPNGLPDLDGTAWLSGFETQLGPMFTPVEIPALGSPIADVIGRDAYTADQPTPAFCTQMRAHRYTDAQGVVWDDMLRVEIRVFWDRSGNPAPIDCAINPLAVNNSQDRFGAVYLTTAVRRNDIRK